MMNEGRSLYCTFRAGGRLFGVPILDVREVTTVTACTRIPHTPPEVLGYVNIRGHIFLALDLRRLLELTGEKNETDRRLVIFKASVGPAFGVMVDEIGEIVSVTPDQIEHIQGSQELRPGERADLVANACKLETELLIVLEPRRFLPLIEDTLYEISPSASVT
jgi:purine-binding chemotaxis protein CheW